MNISRLTRNPVALATTVLALVLLAAIVIGLVSMPKKEKISVPVHRAALVSITSKGFVPAVLNVKAGTRIVWTNTDQTVHQIVSNPHPTHKDLPGLKSEILNKDQTYEYMADKTGSFGYHDEMNPVINGRIEIRN